MKQHVYSLGYIGVSMFATWWISEYEKGHKPNIQIMWVLVKITRSLRQFLTYTESHMVTMIDTMLEV